MIPHHEESTSRMQRCLRGQANVQSGQALLWGTLLLGIMTVAFLAYFGVSNMAADKARQTHALDAAAYSGALFQARTMNMLSHINRAHIAHQVAMAHLTTLSSWAALGETQSRQLLSGNPPVHVVRMMFGADHGAAYAAARRAAGLGLAQSQLASAYMAHDATVRQVLSRTQSHIVDTMLEGRDHVIRAVLKENYEIFQLTDFRLDYDSDDWPGSLIKAAGTTHLAPIVRAAAGRFGFLAPRNDTAYNNWVVSLRCPWLRHQLRRRGATRMDAQGRWQSVDTLSYHALRSNRWIGCYHREYPMGWGWLASAMEQTMSGPHMPTPPDDFSESDFWRWVQDHTDWDIATGKANPLANSRALVGKRLWDTAGLPGLFDLADSTANETIGFALTLRRSTDDAHLITTRSAAETFFARPDAHVAARDEPANLFRPYWQARLAGHPHGTGER